MYGSSRWRRGNAGQAVTTITTLNTQRYVRLTDHCKVQSSQYPHRWQGPDPTFQWTQTAWPWQQSIGRKEKHKINSISGHDRQSIGANEKTQNSTWWRFTSWAKPAATRWGGLDVERRWEMLGLWVLANLARWLALASPVAEAVGELHKQSRAL